MFINMQDVLGKFKDPVADVYSNTWGVYRNCDIIADETPNPTRFAFVSEGMVYILPMRDITRILVHDRT